MILEISRPTLLIVEQEHGLWKDLAGELIRSGPRVATCPVEPVALEFAAQNAPTMVLMDASFYYLEGSAICRRWRSACAGSRLVFVDADGPWIMLIEPPDDDSGLYPIVPCLSGELARTILEMAAARRPEPCAGAA